MTSSDVIATPWWQFFPNACLWRRSLCSNLAGIDSEKLYRATFICQYGLFCCMALVSFRLFCKNLGNLQEFFGQKDYRPPGQKIARTPMVKREISSCIGAARKVSPDWSQNTMTCHSFNCSSIVWGQS